MAIEPEIAQEVAKRLAASNGNIKEAIITTKVDEKLNQRKALALATLESIAAYQKKLADMEQDVLFDGEGKPVLTGFNPKQNADRQKFKKEIERLETALANALGEKADWSGLEK